VETELVIAILGVAGTLGGSALTYAGTRRKYKSELDRLERERQHERERSFEKARFGYRKLYEKFMGHYDEALRLNGPLDALNADYHEIQSVGFKPVCAALDEFWPDSRRTAGTLPLREKIEPLRAAIRLHVSIQLSQLDEMQRRGEA
jgi:hypothetical protein